MRLPVAIIIRISFPVDLVDFVDGREQTRQLFFGERIIRKDFPDQWCIIGLSIRVDWIILGETVEKYGGVCGQDFIEGRCCIAEMECFVVEFALNHGRNDLMIAARKFESSRKIFEGQCRCVLRQWGCDNDSVVYRYIVDIFQTERKSIGGC